MRGRRGSSAVLMAVLALSVAGCGVGSQVDALKPVAGDAVTGLTIAAIDVLEEVGVPIKVAPVCTFEGEVYTCKGRTMAGKPISVTAEGADPEAMSVSVGGRTVYEGSIDDVLARAAGR